MGQGMVRKKNNNREGIEKKRSIRVVMADDSDEDAYE